MRTSNLGAGLDILHRPSCLPKIQGTPHQQQQRGAGKHSRGNNSGEKTTFRPVGKCKKVKSGKNVGG